MPSKGASRTRHRAEILAATLGAILGFLGALAVGTYGLWRAKVLD